jgi:hypothetical protein
MGIAGDVPERGLRIVLERARGDGPPWLYRGEITTPAAHCSASATVSADGHVDVELPADAPPGLGNRLRLVLRAAWKHAQADGTPPPLRVARWRAGD